MPVALTSGERIRAGVAGNRAQFYRDFAMPFFGYNKPDAKVS